MYNGPVSWYPVNDVGNNYGELISWRNMYNNTERQLILI